MQFKRYYQFIIILILAIMIVGCSKGTGGTAGESTSSTTPTQTNEANKESAKSTYPERNIEMIVGYGAGGGTDNFARSIGRELERMLNVKVNVINKPGSSGSIALEYALTQPADGYTISVIPDFPILAKASESTFKLDDFKTIARIQREVLTIQVKGKDGTYANIDELLQEAKENPGKITMGGIGAIGSDELVPRKLRERYGIDFNYVSFDEAAQMHAALLGGHIDSTLDKIGTTISLLEDGLMDVVLVFEDERLADFPDVPTSVEKGLDMIEGLSRGIIVHKDTPDEIVQILEDAFREAREQPEYQEFEQQRYLHLKNGFADAKAYREELEEQVEVYTNAYFPE